VFRRYGKLIDDFSEIILDGHVGGQAGSMQGGAACPARLYEPLA